MQCVISCWLSAVEGRAPVKMQVLLHASLVDGVQALKVVVLLLLVWQSRCQAKP